MGLFFTKNAGNIIQKLNHLNMRIASSVNEDEGPYSVASTFLGITFNNKKRRNYPLADVREIEQELSWILDELSSLTRGAPHFVIVFDEIDKIDPSYNYDQESSGSIMPEFEHIGSGFPGGATSRKRKQNLLKMLANMKFFISTAKAKFIFIAGRELYDAFFGRLI
ncbi:MAG: hypothetical protein LIP05_01270 [Tannerellaceae bacterium]|nr:hypothetical protein [Tannerellaceae bacterium]